MTDVRLPHKLSELAQIALDDVTKVETLPGFQIDMGNWARSYNGGNCHVCAAGAVMVERLGLRNGEGVQNNEQLLERFGYENGAALLAIDALRRGCINDAIRILDSEDPAETWDLCDLDPDCDDHRLSRKVPLYGHQNWRMAMETLVADLHRVGL